MQDHEDDVERGYYVYAHRDRATGKLFYVGKGKGRRAHSPEGHNPDWCNMVAALTDGYDVEFVQKDLTEGDAYDLERETIRKYGRTSEGGTLVNVTGGGMLDMGENVGEIHFQLPPQIAQELQRDYEEGEYRKLTGDERTTFTEALMKRMARLSDRYNEAVETDSGDEEETGFEMDVENIVLQVSTAASQYARRKISSKDFGYEIDCLCEEMEGILEDLQETEGEKVAVIEIAREFVAFTRKQVKSIKLSNGGDRFSA